MFAKSFTFPSVIGKLESVNTSEGSQRIARGLSNVAGTIESGNSDAPNISWGGVAESRNIPIGLLKIA